MKFIRVLKAANGTQVKKNKEDIQIGDILILDDLYYVTNIEHNGDSYLRDVDRNRLVVCTLKEVHGPVRINKYIGFSELPEQVDVIENYKFHNK